jgi:hypothetical protein
MRWSFGIPRALAAVTVAGIALAPALSRVVAGREVARALRAAGASHVAAIDTRELRFRAEPALASWGTIGGCGAAGGSASSPGGGIKWVGRNVTGGLVDAQALTTQTYAQGNRFGAVTTRLGTNPTSRLGLALNVPVLYKTGQVTVLGTTKDTGLAGFGDLSVEASYKLGGIGAHQVMVVGNAPTGAWDAVREGVVLPQHLQLGSGVPGVSAQYQYTRDRDWGLVLVGAAASWAGWENDLGDWRSPSATAFAHVGYMLGPWVPSAGLTLFAKPKHDRERGAERPASRDPRLMVVPSLGIEWSSAWLAVLPAATFGLSPNGVESITFGVGVSSSLF